MRKTCIGVAVLTLLFALTACSTSKQGAQSTMIIKPSEFSEETKQVLDLFDKEIMFFDFVVDETVKASTINVWVYENGEWVDKGATSGNIDKTENQIAIQITESGYNIFTIDESGHIKYSAPKMNISFKNTTQQLSSKITNPTGIIVGEEIPLWVKIGNNENEISIPTDFRSSNCTAGIAVTVTFSNQKIS